MNNFSMFPALGHSQLVAAIIFGVGGVTLDPVIPDLMPGNKREQLLPKVHVQGGLFIALDPTLFLPAIDPALGQGINNVLAVAVKLYHAGLLQ